MTQNPLHNPLSFLKASPANSSSSSVASQNSNHSRRSRSGSFMRVMSQHNVPTGGAQSSSSSSTAPNKPSLPSAARRSMSVSEGLHNRLNQLHHHADVPSPATEMPPFPFNASANLSSSSIAQISEHNWANKLEDFDMKKPIGYGSSAVVYGAVYKPLNKRVAIKMIDLDMFERNQIDELRRETSLMALSKHPNVLRVYGSFVSGSKLYIVTPYLSAGSCLDIMKTTYPDGLDEISIATILKQALEGLVYLHKNGHIHRDIKAGNLLMDDHGTVLLADFGVSSSLAENGDLRKTFVGTPCWMAPEVMEQAGYDFKADIWSFGITAIELATGHAPFAKYPPMKVLMMTLSNAPPTLDREHTKLKYSKVFKEMIDCCLQKDPKKRPTAERLLQHPFFKQAKKKEYLCKSVLADVPPLEQRPHKKAPQRHISFESTDQWDFDTQPDTDAEVPDKTTTEPSKAPSSSVPTSTAPSSANPTTSVTTINTAAKPSPSETPTQSKPSTPADSTAPAPPKKHISFGNVVIKDMQPRSAMPPVVESPSPMSASPQQPVVPTDFATQPAAAVKKSRFVIEDNRDPNDTAHSATMTPSPDYQSLAPSPALPSAVEPTHDTAPASSAVGLGISTATPHEVEVKKGRFSVNQSQQTRPSTPSDEAQDKPTTGPPQPLQGDFRALPISRAASHDSLPERKSRFEIKHGNSLPPSSSMSHSATATVQGGEVQQHAIAPSMPVTRDNSFSSSQSLSRDSSVNGRLSRFSIEKNEAAGPYCEFPNLTPECRKKGRFELSGGSAPPDVQGKAEKAEGHHYESPSSFVSGSPTCSPSSSLSRGQERRLLDPNMPQLVYSHMEALLKQTEQQKNMLHEMLFGMSMVYGTQGPSGKGQARSRTVSETKRPPSTVREPSDSTQRTTPLSSELSATLEHLQHLLIASNHDREKLARENEALKRELERLRRSHNATSINVNKGPTTIVNTNTTNKHSDASDLPTPVTPSQPSTSVPSEPPSAAPEANSKPDGST
ncbi:kinase-like domain-containing protein [Radiomyces spectabilis]|uniref:kinase-like domain-containing protein n=1 Tax=Radiomyces spectabilis TaxID=64574 RepID=UPI00222122D8|nr:kinase-like domain-containing protein [Radiomyces spectabilis]KAI8371579.1 kinase-like domain-containing protein [Radiomyces spectabilis]